jgi:hypothetical protein
MQEAHLGLMLRRELAELRLRPMQRGYILSCIMRGTCGIASTASRCVSA